LDSENVSMDVRSSPVGTLLRLRCEFGPLVGVRASALDPLSVGCDRRQCPDCPDAGGFTSWACEVTARPLGRRFRFLDVGGVRADAGERPADAVRSDWGRSVWSISIRTSRFMSTSTISGLSLFSMKSSLFRAGEVTRGIRPVVPIAM
jgi:hypothetical protein